MSVTITESVALLALAAMVTALAVHLLVKHTKSQRTLVALVLLSGVAAALSVWGVDVNVPLNQSHYRPSGEGAPLVVALLAWASRVGLLAAMPLGARRSRTLRSGNR
jgi:cyanate permease